MTRLTVVTRAVFAGLVVSAIVVPGPSSAAVASADDDLSYVNPRYENAATLAIEGTLETVVRDEFEEHPGAEFSYGVRTEQGDLIELPASFAEDAPNGGAFEGELALTGELADDVRAEGVTVTPGKTIDADTRTGQTVVDVAAEQDAPVAVASATVTEPVEAVTTPGVHHAYVAVMSNMGAINLGQVEAEVTAAAKYWETQGAVTDFVVGNPVTYAAAATTDASCGMLQSELGVVWNEAAELFPDIDDGFDFSNSGNHLIVVVPSTCPNGASGWGDVGNSISDGGRSIIKMGSETLATQVTAHEVGHNFGLGHANLDYCLDTCRIASYYNAYSVMGFAISGFKGALATLDTANRRQLQLLEPGEVDDVVYALGADPTYPVSPRGSQSGRRGLRVIDPDNPQVAYFVDYRNGLGLDTGAFYSPGGALDGFGGTIDYAPGVTVTRHVTGERDTQLTSRKVGTYFKTSLNTSPTFETYENPTRSVKIEVQAPMGATAQVKVILAPPTPTLSPSTARVARSMTADTHDWGPGVTFTYQWLIDGSPLPGATAATYTPARAHHNKKLSVAVTGTKVGFPSKTRTSAKSTIYAGYLIPVTPTVGGTHQVGRTLKVYPGSWTYSPKLTYRWYANGVAIAGATSSTYKITSSRRGKYITAKVTGSAYGFYTTTTSSVRTTKVK
ncbi:MAG: M12 family metallo-peptidase [Aeromicrobium sp.]